MFTGIIRSLGRLKEISNSGSNKTFFVEGELSPDLQVDESVSHNGICLTVEKIKGNVHQVTAIAETLKKTNANNWKTGDWINLEQAMQLNDRLDGHIVQGHVDGTGICLEKADSNGSVLFTFQFDISFAPLMIEKGSICINGVSLTAFDVTDNQFSVAIIPYTFSHTNFKTLKKGDLVNLEFDMLGKYIARIAKFQPDK
ncbi:MAG: riboflavin synthase [Ginsengibacter sp.]